LKEEGGEKRNRCDNDRENKNLPIGLKTNITRIGLIYELN
jgi:hypothetical protein